jgi:hypothetical protein
VSAGRTVRWAHGLVVDWTLHLTRGLPEDVARDRVDQIVSDLWEQEHATARTRRSALTLSLLLRAALGVPSDIAWLRDARSRAAGEGSASPLRIEQPGTGTRSTAMSRKQHRLPAGKPWIPLVDDGEKPFDQTNGVVDFDTAAKEDGSDVDLVGKAIASNTANVGFYGGSF